MISDLESGKKENGNEICETSKQNKTKENANKQNRVQKARSKMMLLLLPALGCCYCVFFFSFTLTVNRRCSYDYCYGYPKKFLAKPKSMR